MEVEQIHEFSQRQTTEINGNYQVGLQWDLWYNYNYKFKYMSVCPIVSQYPAQSYNTSHTGQDNILHIIFAKEIRLIRIRVALYYGVWVGFLLDIGLIFVIEIFTRRHHPDLGCHHHACNINIQVDGLTVEVKHIWRLCVCISKNISWVQISINDKEEYSFKKPDQVGL